MKVSGALKAIINKEQFRREESENYEAFIDALAEMLVDFYEEKYAKNAGASAYNSTKSVEK